MSYSPTTPQANQTIAFTQPIILGNFAYIQTNWGVIEHTFNQLPNPGPADGTHLQCSMPNQTLLAAKAAGTDGVYYVNSGTARFYDGTNNFNLCLWTNVQTGTFTPSDAILFDNICIVPGNHVGIIIFYDANAAGFSNSGVFCSDSSTFGYSNEVTNNKNTKSGGVELKNFNMSSFELGGRAWTTNSVGETFKFILFSRPVT